MEIPIGLKRTTAKFSTHMNMEEVQAAIAKLCGVPLDHVPLFDYEAEIAKMRAQHEKVQKIIAGVKALLDENPKTSPGKYEELYDIGKFIIFFNDRFEILPVVQEYPDFTLTYEHYKIGIEHTRLWNDKERAMFKAAKYYITKAEFLLNDLSHLSRTVNIYIDYTKNVMGEGNFDNRKFTEEQRNQIPVLIADFVRSKLTSGNMSKPDFIAQVETTRNEDSRVDLELGESYFTKTEFSDHLLECINKKEKKAANYRTARTVNGLWLLIVVDDINCFSGFNLELATLPNIESSSFDSILLFEKFSGGIHLLYNKTA